MPCGVTIFVTLRKWLLQLFFYFFRAVCVVSRGGVGGVRSVTVGVQFQPDPSRQAKGGVNPNLSAENKQKTSRNEY